MLEGYKPFRSQFYASITGGLGDHYCIFSERTSWIWKAAFSGYVVASPHSFYSQNWGICISLCSHPIPPYH